MSISIEEKLEESDDIQCGSLVFISVFQKNVLYSPTNIIPIVKMYVAYGYKSIDDFFNIYNINNQAQEILSTKENYPIPGFVVGIYDFSIKRPHHTYNLCKMYQVIPEGKINPFWFPNKDVCLCNERNIKKLESLDNESLIRF